jgi:transposase
MTHVMVSRYGDHEPRCRQSGIFARSGIELDRSTLAGDQIHGDDTPVKVLAPGTGKTKSGRLWVYVRDDRPAGDFSPRAA